MKKRCRRKRYKGAMAALLASVLLLTSSQWFQIQAKENPNPATQTGYDSLIDFQVERWNTILKEVFGNTVTPTTVNSNGTSANITIPSADNIKNGKAAVVREENAYFNWDTANTKEKNLAAWSGGSENVTLEQIKTRTEEIQYAEDRVEDAKGKTTVANETKVIYTVYDIYNADQLYCVMNAVKDANYNVKINLCADIDLNGAKQLWNSDYVTPVCNEQNHWYYIEGNGYTIYNMKTCSTVKDYSAGFLGYLRGNGQSKVVLKNLDFSNCLVIGSKAGAAVVVGMNTVRLYMENVNVKDSFLHSNSANVGGILGRNQCTTGAMFMHNCSTSGIYAFGTNHIGGFSGTFYNNNNISSPVRYDTAFPDSPESWMANQSNSMPLMVENCYAVDSELFSVGTEGDSGAFISCGAKIICRNSFTNNIIYGATNTGAFIGRLVTVDSGSYGMQDDKGNHTVANYFENCYASGSVEGRDKIGGFTGYDCGNKHGENNRGITVYKNCYTTAMAGMDYAGRQVGGFIGHENTCINQKASIAIGSDENGNTTYTTNPGSVYINCYAAGEVGNILTETNADYICNTDESDTQGGFLGAVGCWGFDYNGGAGDATGVTKAQDSESNGNYINCYYDMQTTGMRERASGKYYSFAENEKNPTAEEMSQIPGVTGVYTQYSEAKNVMGLAYSKGNEALSVTMDDLGGSSEVWMYRDEYYPALLSFYGDNAAVNFGTLKESGTIISSVENTGGSDGDGIAAASEDTDSEDETVSTQNTDSEDETVSTQNTDGEDETASTQNTDGKDETVSTQNTNSPAKVESIENTDSADKVGSIGNANGPDKIENTEDSEKAEDSEKSENKDDSDHVENVPQDPGQNDRIAAYANAGIQLLDVGDGGTEKSLYDDETKERIQEKLNEKAALVPNYLQASVSTVFLDHWDLAMNMDTGALGGENNWVAGLPANKLTQKEYAATDSNDDSYWSQDDDGKYWEIAYKNLAAGSYELKTQAGTSMTYNFGSDKFNGKNCVLKVPENCDVKVKFDYVAPASITGENTPFRIWAEFYRDLYDETGNEKEEAEPFETQELGHNAMEDLKSTWTVVGSFPGSDWDRTNADFDMDYIGTGLANGDYELVLKLPEGSYSFQITRDHLWDECYGLSGNNGRDENMTFTLSQECEVSILFNEHTHLTTVETNPSGALTASQTKETEVEGFTGYSVISAKEITGYNWLESLAAAQAGEMKDDDGDGIYEASFTVTGKENFDKIHRYKVIKDGRDEGITTYFHLTGPGVNAEEEEYTRTLSFCYKPETGETWVEDKKSDDEESSWVNNDPYVDSWNILGSKSLNGVSWDEGMTEEEKTKKSRGRMELAAGSGTVYSKTYNLVAGTYSFKVAANGSFDSGIEYGDVDGNNYQFTISEPATVHITFDSSTKTIDVKTNPAIALTYTEYVVSGTKSLTGSNWDASDVDDNLMQYQGGYLDTYTKQYTVKNGGEYAFKVVHAGKDDKVEPIGLQVAGEEGKTYILEISYHERHALTEYHLYEMTDGGEKGTEVTEDCIEDIQYDSWSVLGEKELTGYNWEDAANNNQADAAEAGKMTYDKTKKIYTKTFGNIAVSDMPQILNFKVAAEGSWDTGVSYGDSRGNNYTIVLQSQTAKTCSVTITFDPVTHEINVSATPDCLMEGRIDESSLVWYLAGDYDLVSEDAYYTAPTVYDTVRDITAAFTFTSGSHVDWGYDDDRNSASGFFSRIGTTEDGTGFDLDYTVENKSIKGTFNEKVITLEANPDGDHSSYSCSRFMPGKQWVKVTTGAATASGGTTGEEDKGTGSRSIRLIPTAYLEAGNDADIYVLQSASDTKLENVSNTVVYKENDLKGEVDFAVTKDENGGTESKSLTDLSFKRYNVALTAAYAITDRTGFGYYGNYSQQRVQKYDSEKIRSNALQKYETGEYFAMSSAFTKSASYHDEKNIPTGETSNLVIDELVDQNLIGSSYGIDGDGSDENGTETAGTKAKTIIKVARLDADGKTTKVFTTRNTSSGAEKDREKTTYEKNYLKWTGQMPFDSDDVGTYQVTYYWSLSDGRYLSDSKKVSVYSGLASIQKTVDKDCFEIEETKGEKTTQLTYTVTYENPVKGNFSIVDVLPFTGDVRKDSSRPDGYNRSVIGEGTKLKLTSVTATITGVKGSEITDTSYTTSDGVKEYITQAANDTGAAAEKILKDHSGNIIWTSVEAGAGSSGSGIDNATAIKVTGNQPEKGGSRVTLEYTIEVSNAQRGDHYVNNAFFTATGADNGVTVNGVSNPVITAAVGRELSGYVWLDSDVDGRYDDTESAIDGVKVTLQKYDPENKKWTSVGTPVYSGAHKTPEGAIDEHGYYAFTDICPAGDYRVVFSAPDSGKTIVLYQADGTKVEKEVDFSKLYLTRRLAYYQVKQKNLSRNIADKLNGQESTYYINEELPSAEDIFANNTQPYYKDGSVTDYYFTREYQNLGLTELKDVKEKKNSLTIDKREGTLDGTPLGGAEFRLEYSLDGTDYQVVNYYVREDEATGQKEYVFVDLKDTKTLEQLKEEEIPILPADAVATSKDEVDKGKIRFVNLPTADYRLTEVKAPEGGYNPLGAPVEFQLPYSIRQEGSSDDLKIRDGYVTANIDSSKPGTGYDKGELENIVYYYDITYTITNSKPLHMPMTGHWKNLLPLILAGILFAGAVSIYTGYRIKKRRV